MQVDRLSGALGYLVDSSTAEERRGGSGRGAGLSARLGERQTVNCAIWPAASSRRFSPRAACARQSPRSCPRCRSHRSARPPRGARRNDDRRQPPRPRNNPGGQAPDGRRRRPPHPTVTPREPVPAARASVLPDKSHDQQWPRRLLAGRPSVADQQAEADARVAERSRGDARIASETGDDQKRRGRRRIDRKVI
jgi:hypothetical protein